MTNREEFDINLELDPTEADTDGDGLDDGPEVNTYMTNPLDDDSDDDTLLDGLEVNTHMTSPTDPDSDDDTIDDGTEIANGTNPNDPGDPQTVAGFGALCLDGLSFVSFSNDAGLIPSGDAPFTIESWINPTSIPLGGENGGQITFWGTQGTVDTANGFRLRGPPASGTIFGATITTRTSSMRVGRQSISSMTRPGRTLMAGTTSRSPTVDQRPSGT